LSLPFFCTAVATLDSSSAVIIILGVFPAYLFILHLIMLTIRSTVCIYFMETHVVFILLIPTTIARARILSLVQCFKTIQSLKFLFYNLTPPPFATRCGIHIDMHAVNIVYKSCSTAAPGA
jgi:hypothetical protein